MPQRKSIGDILTGSGRISDDDVRRALEHQEEHGGYFGEALVALGLVTEEEVEWGLASQYDLPYVFPDPDSIDPDAAALVTPEWALANLALPIMETADALTVVVDSPMKTEAVSHLGARTEKTIELALASSSRIRELIREVHARAQAREAAERPTPVTLSDFLSLALDAVSNRFGVSVRGPRARCWYEDGGRIRRRPLEGPWESRLEELLSPPPSAEAGDSRRARWTAHVSRSGMSTPVEVRYLADESGREYLFVPYEERAVLEDRFSVPPAGILSEIRLLARSGHARFLVVTDPPELGPELLPHLPALLFEPSWRSVHVSEGRGPSSGEAFSVELPEDRSGWDEELEGVSAFRFDVVTADLGGAPDEWIGRALDLGAVAFLLQDEGRERKAAHDADVRWELRVERQEGGHLEWTLEPLRG